MSQHRSFKDRTPCEKFLARLLGSWSGLGDTEGHNRNIYMSHLRVSHNPRDPGNIDIAVAKSQTSDPDDRIALNFAAYFKCSGPSDVSFILHHQQGNVEIVNGKVENDEGTAATLDSEDRESTGNPKYLATRHRWFFDEKRTNDDRSSTASLRLSTTNNNRPEASSTSAGNWFSFGAHGSDGKMNQQSTYVDDEVLIRHFWVATESNPRLELLQRTKFTTAHHVGGDPNRQYASQLSANAGFY